MFRLRTFGGLWLERDHQRVGGTSSRWLGLLAAVVAAGDRGISRDRLLLLLWPESTESKARHALAQTLYSLRRELGDDLIRSEPAELLVNPSQLGSDLTDFLEASAAGEFERAAAMYSGPFLDGFYLPGADEFERWAEIERTGLRETAIEAMEGAAKQARAAGRTGDAAALWRRASVIAPLNSRVALGYMSSLADAGDVAGAIQYGRAHEVSRRQELGAQPDPAVGALLVRLASGAWESGPSAGNAMAGEASPPVPSAATAAAHRSDRSEPGVPGPARFRRILGGLLAGGVVALSLWLLPPLLSGRTAFPDGSLVVMADPVDLSGEPGLSGALASAAVVGLQQSKHLTPLSRTRVSAALRRMGRSGDSLLTDSLALEVAAREGARAVLTMTVAKVSSTYVLTGRLLSPVDGAAINVHRVSVNSLGELIDGLDRLLREVLAGAGESRSDRDSVLSLPLVTTGSLEALKLYAEAGALWRAARYDRARSLFERAVAIDSGFALAHVALGSFSYFVNDRPSGDRHYADALRHRNRLSFREQLTLDSRLAAARGDRGEESRIDGLLAERFPARDTWYNYGTTLMRMDRCEEGVTALRRSITFDSTWSNPHINIATCYKRMGENRLSLDAYAAAERADSTALVSFNVNHEWGGVFVRLERYAEAEAAFRRMLARPERNDQARGHRSLAYLDLMRGRFHTAIEHLTTAVELSRATNAGVSQLRNQTLLAEAHLSQGTPQLAGRELEDGFKILRAQYVEPSFLALFGRVLVRANRLGDARTVLARLDSVVKPGNLTDQSVRGLLRAELAMARGEPEAANEAIRGDIDPGFAHWRSALMGRILAGRGKLDSALVVTAAFARGNAFGGDTQADWVNAPLEVARIAEALGDSATARAALQTFLDRWKDADPELRILREVRVHLDRLRREAGR